MKEEKRKKHSWLYDRLADFYTCENCNEEISGFLFDYHRNGEENVSVVLDKIANKGCKNGKR
jgi:hypothetical protein